MNVMTWTIKYNTYLEFAQQNQENPELDSAAFIFPFFFPGAPLDVVMKGALILSSFRDISSTGNAGTGSFLFRFFSFDGALGV